ncbi:MAG TPA: type ISP restriction/modification enzyme, partial [Actinomycetota bacterium]|nr:type ISP restriction/modification enzyme [Actinomycetota bacterium]
LPKESNLLRESAVLGDLIAKVFDTTRPIDGVTQGPLSPPFIGIARLTKEGDESFQPKTDLEVRAEWGHRTKEGIMPRQGRVKQRDFSAEELDQLESEGFSPDVLGATTFDVFLNDQMYWANVPEDVWNFMVGGYQVLKKWLSYREFDVMGRPLHPSEADEVSQIARRITLFILARPKLNANYDEVQQASYTWSELSDR